MTHLFSTNFNRLLLVFLINIAIILMVYKSVFSLELEGDSWFYGWGHQVYYESNVFSPLSLKGMRTSLGGASLTFGLIQNHFGLSAIIFYSISVVLKLLSVVAFYFLVNKLTKSFIISLVASMLLAVSFAGVEATHWVFNMYAYIGLIFILISLIVGIDLPKKYLFKKWLVAFLFASFGIWYATMRTNGIIPLIIIWAIYKVVILRSPDSKKNLFSWIAGFAIFVLIDKFLLGQMESSYSQVYIIGEGIKAIQFQLANHKYDFLVSSATNLGAVILPDVTWNSFSFPKLFSFFGKTIFSSVILPSTLFFLLFARLLTSVNSRFILLSLLGCGWSLLIFLISRLGPLNFQSWVSIVITLFGGYIMLTCLFLILIKNIPSNLKDLFFLSFFWFFLFLLLPLFQNGGGFFGTYHRYMVTTAPSVPLFIAGLLSLSAVYKSTPFRILLFLIILLMFFNHAINTKAFFDRKAVAHNREVSNRIWQQFKSIVPNKPQYLKQPPAIFFAAADNPVDQETLFESLAFGYDFRADLAFKWPHNQQNYIYNSGNYKDLVKAVKKDPKILDEFYAILVQNQNLFDITKQVKEKLASDIALP